MKILFGVILSIVFAVNAVTAIFNLEWLTGLGYMAMFAVVALLSLREFKDSNIAAIQAEKEIAERKRIDDGRQKILSGRKFVSMDFRYLGGYGCNLNEGDIYFVAIMDDCLKIISNNNSVSDIYYNDVVSYEVGGPGTTKTDAGVSGGGFGIEGFIKGAVTAAVINAVTTRSSTNTLLKVTSKNSEIFLHTSMCEPEELKIALSPLSIILSNRADHSKMSVADELTKLSGLLKDGIITEEDFMNAKSKLLN